MAINKHPSQMMVGKALAIALGQLSRLIADNQPISDSFEEEVLRLELAANPGNWESTYKLVAAIFRQQRLPIPDDNQTEPDQSLSGDELAEIQLLEEQFAVATAALDTISVFASAWAMVLRFPHSAYGMARFASHLAERGYFDDATKIVAGVVRRKPLQENTWRALSEAACVIAEYQPWIARKLLDDLQSSTSYCTPIENAHFLELARIAGVLGIQNFHFVMPKADRRQSAAELRLLAKRCYAVGQLQDAYDLFVLAIKLEQGHTLRDILRNFGGAFGYMLFTLGKDAEIRNLLDRGYDGECNLISAWHAPESLFAAQQARNQAMERELPSVLLVTPGKSGTVAVGNILSSGFNLPTMVTAISTNNVIPAWASEFARGGAIHTTQMRPTSDNVAAIHHAGVGHVIVHVRDPRQIIVSLAHHLSKYKAQFGAIEGFATVADRSLVERVDFLIREILPDRVNWMRGWLKARNQLAIGFTTYEMFASQPAQFLDVLLSHYHGDTRFFNAEAAHGPTGVDGHFRMGSIDEWRGVLTRGQINEMNRIVGDDLLTTFGWN